MTPDKVYLQEGFSVSVVGFVSPAWDNPKDKENTVEYIRKEALLEKISNLYFSAYEKAERSGKDEDVATQNAFAVVIDDIKSM